MADGSNLQWTVGDVQITSIVESETPTSPRFLFSELTRPEVLAMAERAPWLRPHFVDDDGYLLQKIQCLIVDDGTNRIAVDTCIGNDKQRVSEFWNNLQTTFLDDMADAGYEPESITHVVCTHLHVDHVGWNTRLVDGEWQPTFPNATYLFVTDEYNHWEAERSAEQATEPAEDVFGDSVAPIVAAGLAEFVGSDHEITDSVKLQPTPGHTPGHVSVEISADGERAVITGDMTHSPIQMVDPALSSQFDVDPERARRSRSSAFADWSDGATVVIGTHFGTPTSGTLHPDGDGYRLSVSFDADADADAVAEGDAVADAAAEGDAVADATADADADAAAEGDADQARQTNQPGSAS